MSYGRTPTATGVFGTIQHVVGTVDEVVKHGFSPERVGSCSEQTDANQGCPHWGKCIFARQANGAFRGKQGPLNVGYFLQTHEGTKIETEASCEWFMDKMYERQRAGKRDREDGKNGEIIDIIAIEPGLDHPLSGQKIHRSTIVNVNEGTNLPHKWQRKYDTGPVRKFPRLGDRENAGYYDQQLDDRRRLREAQEEMRENRPPMRLDPQEVDTEASAEPIEETVVEVKRGPGRPRKDA